MCTILELYLQLNGTSWRELVSFNFLLVVLHTVSIITKHLWCLLRGIVWIWMKSYLFCSLRAKLSLAPSGIPKWVWLSMNRFRVFFVEISTLPPSMHSKLTQYGRCNLQNNQLRTKTHVELGDNYIEEYYSSYRELYNSWRMSCNCKYL